MPVMSSRIGLSVLCTWNHRSLSLSRPLSSIFPLFLLSPLPIIPSGIRTTPYLSHHHSSRSSCTSRSHSTFPSGSDPVTDSNHRQCYVEHLTGDDAGISIVTLNRPQAKNSLSRAFLLEFRNCLEYINTHSPTRVVIVRSTVDKVFCAGADLKERATMTPTEVATFVSTLRTNFNDLNNINIPTIAAIDGAALGGGLELALCCDLRTAGPLAKFGLPETKLAIIPGAGGSQRLPRLIGIPLAKELMYTGRIVTPNEALNIRLINRLHEESAFMAALDLARSIVPQGPIALRMAKQSIDLGSQLDLPSGLKVEELCYAHVIPTKDRLEGLTAFAEKRIPVYKGE